MYFRFISNIRIIQLSCLRSLTAAAFLAGVTGVSILFGFGTTLAAAKKKDPHFFDQGLTGRIEGQAAESISNETVTAMRRRVPGSIASVEPGASLAIRALGWGTLYAVTGCSVLFYGIWKLMAVNDVSIILPQYTTSINNNQLSATHVSSPPKFASVRLYAEQLYSFLDGFNRWHSHFVNSLLDKEKVLCREGQKKNSPQEGSRFP